MKPILTKLNNYHYHIKLCLIMHPQALVTVTTSGLLLVYVN